MRLAAPSVTNFAESARSIGDSSQATCLSEESTGRGGSGKVERLYTVDRTVPGLLLENAELATRPQGRFRSLQGDQAALILCDLTRYLVPGAILPQPSPARRRRPVQMSRVATASAPDATSFIPEQPSSPW